MLAIKINDPYTEEYLAEKARTQGKSRQALVRDMLRKQIEDEEDYQAAVKAMEEIKSGRSRVIDSQEMWGKLGLDN